MRQTEDRETGRQLEDKEREGYNLKQSDGKRERKRESKVRSSSRAIKPFERGCVCACVKDDQINHSSVF